MFKPSARYYDLIYSWKNYEEEVVKLHSLIQAKNPGARTLLDVACGTGRHLELLRQDYQVEGVDLEADLLELAGNRLPGISLHRADMRDFDLGRQFDAVTCLFSSIGYARDVNGLERAVGRMASHLAPNGVLVVEPWILPERFEPGHIHALFVDEPEIKIVRMNTGEVEGRLSILTFHYLVGTPKTVEHFTERHEMGLFEHEEYVTAFEKAGLEVSHDPEGLMGRGLYVGRRPA